MGQFFRTNPIQSMGGCNPCPTLGVIRYKPIFGPPCVVYDWVHALMSALYLSVKSA